MRFNDPKAPFFGRVVVGVDTAADSRIPIRLGAWMAGADGRLELVHAIPDGFAEPWVSSEGVPRLSNLRGRRQQDREKRLAGLAQAGPVSAGYSVVIGSVPNALISTATLTNSSLVVVGSHRPVPDRTVGSTAKAVLRAADIPVLVARERKGANPAQPITTIAIATDFTDSDSDAARWAVRFAQATGARLRIVHVVDPHLWWDEAPHTGRPGSHDEQRTWGAIQEAHRRRLALFEQDCRAPHCETHQLVGQPVAAILDYAVQQEVDVLVVGTKANERFPWLPLGSVAGELAERAPCSVLVWRRRGASSPPGSAKA